MSATGDLEPVPAEPPVRVCPKCSTQSQAGGDFCQHCGARYGKRKRSKKARALMFGGPSLAVLAAAIVAVALVIHHNNEVAARKHAAAVAAATAARVRAQRLAAAKAVTKLKHEEAAAEKLVEDSKRSSLVSFLERNVKKTADKDVADGVLNGPIVKVQCEPATAADATATIATYSCVAATSQSSGGTLNGYGFTGTINLKTDGATWHLGNS